MYYGRLNAIVRASKGSAYKDIIPAFAQFLKKQGKKLYLSNIEARANTPPSFKKITYEYIRKSLSFEAIIKKFTNKWTKLI